MQPHQDPTARIGAVTRFARLSHVISCESTQDLAHDDPEPESAIFWADHQARGRGRQGHVWNDDAGKDLAVTFKIEGLALANTALLAAAVPVAALLAIEQASGLRVALKWPNDLMVSGRKLAGILIDSAGTPPVHHVGIGINVNRTGFPPELRGTATALALLTGREYDREDLLVQLAVGVEEALRDLELGRFDRLAGVFRDRLGLLGKRVVLASGGEERTGRLTAIDLAEVALDGGERTPLAVVQKLALG